MAIARVFSGSRIRKLICFYIPAGDPVVGGVVTTIKPLYNGSNKSGIFKSGVATPNGLGNFLRVAAAELWCRERCWRITYGVSFEYFTSSAFFRQKLYDSDDIQFFFHFYDICERRWNSPKFKIGVAESKLWEPLLWITVLSLSVMDFQIFVFRQCQYTVNFA